MTDDLFSRDAYLATCAATVVGATDDGVVLDRTVFYARGGGQPGDTGVLRWGEHVTPVTDTVKARHTGEIVHLVEGDAPPDGSAVACDIDWPRRYLHMRTHTALHSLSGIIFAEYGAKVTGGNMESGGTACLVLVVVSLCAVLGRVV